MYRIGSDFIGSDDIKTTAVENTEIIQQHRKNPSDTWFSVYSLTFKTFTNCHVKINGGSPIFLEANMAFSTSHYDPLIRTFEIVESGVQYYYIGAF